MGLPLLQKGACLSSGADRDRWVVSRKLGEGQFAEVYEVKDTLGNDARYAAKIDKRRDVKSVKQEFRVLQRLAELSTLSVCATLATGTFEERFFVVMEAWEPREGEPPGRPPAG
ncbi:hypothetical protein FOA52_000556 [Chlamydomonas sp. UWO 241]|nr:hypothetical protein FOA52_000556 [Chlamydomonas sp. UWO 241]